MKAVKTEAEDLLALADAVLLPRRMLVLSDGGIGPTELAVVRLAISLKARAGLSFRAVVEDWSRERIVKELY